MYKKKEELLSSENKSLSFAWRILGISWGCEGRERA